MSVGAFTVSAMFSVLAVQGYRSLRDLRVALGRLTIITGPNGSGKSSLYRALRLLAACGQGRVIGALAREGGLASALWAGPESLGGARRGHAVSGTVRRRPTALQLGVAGEGLGYLVDLGVPQRLTSAFDRDPQIKREAVWSGPLMRPATLAAQRTGGHVRIRDDDGRWVDSRATLPPYRSMLAEFAEPQQAPELWAMRRAVQSWRFYDGFRVDADAPARHPQVGTRTPVLADDGADLAAALQTIVEDGRAPLGDALADAFPGAQLAVEVAGGMFDVALSQPGMLRPLRSAELSDGTLRYLLWLAALLTPEPAPLVVLNEPETSLHASLVPPLARLIAAAAQVTQVIVVTHADALVRALVTAMGEPAPMPGARDGPSDEPDPPRPGEVLPLRMASLVKECGETYVEGQGLLAVPAWEWGRR